MDEMEEWIPSDEKAPTDSGQSFQDTAEVSHAVIDLVVGTAEQDAGLYVFAAYSN